MRASLSVDTGENRDTTLLIRGQKYEAEVVGLIAKMPGTAMTAHNVGSNKISTESDSQSFDLGRSVITTHSAMKLILAEESSRDAQVKEKLDFLNSQYESKDDIPKSVVHIKIDESISQERYDEIMFGVGQQIRDQALTTYDKRS